MEFKIVEVDEKYKDTCEQCDNEQKPVYHLKGHTDNFDTMLCQECLQKLKVLFSNIE